MNNSLKRFNEGLNSKETMYKAYLEQAREIRLQNNDIPSKEEFYYLTEAAKAGKELAKMTRGEAQQMLLDNLQKVKERREEIAKYLDPDGYNRLIEKRKQEEAAAALKGTPYRSSSSYSSYPSNPVSEKSGQPQNRGNIASLVDQETINSWFPAKPKDGFDKVAGMKPLVERLRNCALGAQWNKVKDYLNMPTVHTYFFYGVPGCGKTFISKAFAHELMNEDYSYMFLTAGMIMSSKVSVAEQRIERVFEEAKNHAPCILFIDEIDGVCADRNDENTPMYARTLTTSFLNGYNSLMDFDGKVIFIGATNYPDLVDKAMLDRAELIYVDMPDKDARANAFRMKFEPLMNLEPGFTYEEMADRTEKYNYRDIDRLEEHLKDRIFALLREKYDNEEEAFDALKAREFPLTREVFDAAFHAYSPTPRENEILEMKKWRERITAK